LIGGQAVLVGEILVPGEVGWVDVVEEHFPLFSREVNSTGVRFLRMGFFGAARGFAVGVGAGIGGVFEEALESPLGGLAPQELAALGTGKRAVREEELVVAEIAEETAERADLGEPGEDISEALPDSLVGVEGHGAIGLADQADGEREGQFPPLGLVFAGGDEAAPEKMKFGFGEGAFETQEEAVVVGVRIVDSVSVGEEGLGKGTEFQEAVPVGAGAGQAGNFDAEDQADVPQGNLGGELLEARAEVGGSGRLA
jgi:hypothetical protein